jgi:hypothetical protein
MQQGQDGIQMNELLKTRAARPVDLLKALTAVLLVAVSAIVTAAPIDERQLLDVGFKVLVADTNVKQAWVRGLPPGKIRAMQRTGKKFFIYPDATRNQVYVGGPKEYEAYVKLRPENGGADAQKAALEASAYRMKQSEAMQKATARDLSDPFLGASWADLGW